MERIPEMKNHIDKFIELAKLNTDEAWEEIDSKLSQYCNNQDVLDWAKENTANSDSGLSDLAATILEATNNELDGKDIDNLVLLMRSDDAENPYPSFRAACALAKRVNSGLLTESILSEVKDKLKIFTKDKNISDIAKSYIDSLSE